MANNPYAYTVAKYGHAETIAMYKAYSSNRPRGEDAWESKLTAAMVRDIRSNPQLTLKQLQARYPFVTFQAIAKVRKRQTWKHIP